MKKFSIAKIFRFAPVLLVLFGISSCSFFEDSFNEPVKDYFKKYTETSAVTEYELVSGAYEISSGCVYVSSSADFEARLFLRNPQKYIFPADCINLSFPRFEKDAAETKFGAKIDLSGISISQDEKDASVLVLKYPAEFLVLAETGFDISPEIRLFHPVSKADFGSWASLKAVCNSPPPLVFGAAVYKDSARGKYVVFFNMPSKGLLSGIHSDLKSVSVNQEKCNVLLNPDGTFSFDGDNFHSGNDSSSFSAASVEFFEYGQAAYFVTDDVFSDETNEYAISLFDEAGFSSSVSVSVYSVRLGRVEVSDISGNVLESGGIVSQDEGSSYATLNISPAQTAKDYSGVETDVSDSIVVYEMYQGTDDSGKVLYSGNNSGGKMTIQVPAGQVFLRLYSHKDLFADSVPVEYGIQVLKSVLFVSPDGSDTGNNGSQNSPFATVAKTFGSDGFSDITVLGTVELAGNIDENVELSIPDANVVINGNGNSLASLKMSASGGKLKTNSLGLTGGITAENGGFRFAGGSVGGGITVAGGSVTVENCESVDGEINVKDGILVLKNCASLTGGITVSGGSVTVENCESVGGEINVNAGTLVLKNCASLTGGITVSGGNVAVENCDVSGKISYNGGKLLLSGGTAVSEKIEIGAAGLSVYVKNLTAPKVASISGVENWKKSDKVLVSDADDEKSIAETCRKFSLSSEKWILTADADGKCGILSVSGGSFVVSEYEVQFALAPEGKIARGGEITVSASVTDSSGNTVSVSDSDFTDWQLKIFNHGADTGVSASKNKISTGKNWPADKYQLFVSVKYKGSGYSSMLDFEIQE